MTTRLPSTNIVLVAFVAIMGMLSFADVASACTSTTSGSTSRACCADRPPAECGCCGKVEALPSSAEVARVDATIIAAPARLISQASSPSCECRANGPAAPSERPAQRTTRERTELQGGETLAVVSLTVRPSPALSRFLPPNESPLKSPLYLRTSHLLI